MKTIAISLSLLFMSQTAIVQAMTNTDDKKKVSTENNNPKDSTSVEKDSEFSVVIEDNVVKVFVNGEFDPYASVSINSNRGSDLYFEFINNNEKEFSFDISKLEKGSYFVLLNSNEEIRMKRFLID